MSEPLDAPSPYTTPPSSGPPSSGPPSSGPPSAGRLTAPGFAALKASGGKLTMVTAYDYALARWADEAGVEGVLVGDSLSMVVQGRENTLHVTLDEMIYHAEMVGRAVEHALVVVDMPFPSFHLGKHKAIENAGRILKKTRCQAVKLEGGVDQADTIAALTSAGIPVMAHCGLRPQNVHQLGGYKVHRDEEQLLADAMAAQSAGAFAMVLECIPSAAAQRITSEVRIPTIGIGAGAACDGQVLVINDLLGITSGYVPRFVKAYADLKTEIHASVKHFISDVRDGQFPNAEHGYE
ncbi:MAG: 3-methyl-2-oxobutanoate hydroxymethyltransferase [Planctomycetales bacterium]|nr:3-methyl-2-oxobutanoate hydroxymethyltransferase [Planctomycetales bacterium]